MAFDDGDIDKIDGLGPHITAEKIKKHVTKEQWETYTKIVTEANPWDKVVSWFFWDLYNDKKINLNFEDRDLVITFFQEWFENKVKPLDINDNTNNNPLSHKYYFIGDEVVGEFFIKKENLNEDLKNFLSQLNLPFDEKILKDNNSKTGIRPSWSKDYKLFFNDENKKIVLELCAETIKILNYEY